MWGWLTRRHRKKAPAKDNSCKVRNLYQLHEYQANDGSFDYDLYRQTQEEGNQRKLDWVWVKEDNIRFVSDYITQHIALPELGICHGTRQGNEQLWFRKYLGCEVFGTEISETAGQFDHTIQWDFHEVKPEWIDSIDFIYSNSFDHTYDPEKCLNAWMRCLKPNGLCFIEHSSLDSYQNIDELDAFGADLIVMPFLITTWGRGRYGVREILDAPRVPQNLDYLKIIVIQRFNT